MNNWEEHYKELPEYNNKKQEEPFIIAKFKFRNQKDFDEFNELLKKYVYKTNKVFDGMQRKTEKQAWFPLKEKASKYLFIDSNET
tara:strand:+ start:353 stop:607 length:255 start_codon:yes stop_codon:yes gene_type:complete